MRLISNFWSGRTPPRFQTKKDKILIARPPSLESLSLAIPALDLDSKDDINDEKFGNSYTCPVIVFIDILIRMLNVFWESDNINCDFQVIGDLDDFSNKVLL